VEIIMPKTFVEVLLDQNLSKRLDYSVPDEWAKGVVPGMRVTIPLKGMVVQGTIAAVKSSSSVPGVRPIVALLSTESELSDSQWQLAHWMSRYYATSLQKVLKCFVPPSIRQGVSAKTQNFISLNITHEEALKTIEQLRCEDPEGAILLETVLQKKKGVFATELLEQLSLKNGVISRFIKKKILIQKKVAITEDLLLEEEFFKTKSKILNEEQKICVDRIYETIAASKFEVHLVHGVTGSGKTEVYLQAIEKALKENKGTILLVPEVSLTSQTIERFRARFAEPIAILHHKRSLGERSEAWKKLRKGEIRIAVGARSAIFAPLPNLGLIIVDEEHDNSYKQSDEMPCYHARNIAVMRAHIEKATVILGSATPSVESRYNAEIGKYRLHTLSGRAGNARPPKITIVDMKRAMDMQGGFTHFSQELLEGIKERLKLGEQTLLFLNRRGYHRLQICGTCRATIKCPHCDLGLTFHREANHLRCHLCDYRQKTPRQCPKCASFESLQFKGFGTEHVERSLHAIFPEIRTLRMDRDTTGKKIATKKFLNDFELIKQMFLLELK